MFKKLLIAISIIVVTYPCIGQTNVLISSLPYPINKSKLLNEILTNHFGYTNSALSTMKVVPSSIEEENAPGIDEIQAGGKRYLTDLLFFNSNKSYGHGLSGIVFLGEASPFRLVANEMTTINSPLVKSEWIIENKQFQILTNITPEKTSPTWQAVGMGSIISTGQGDAIKVSDPDNSTRAVMLINRQNVLSQYILTQQINEVVKLGPLQDARIRDAIVALFIVFNSFPYTSVLKN